MHKQNRNKISLTTQNEKILVSRLTILLRVVLSNKVSVDLMSYLQDKKRTCECSI